MQGWKITRSSGSPAPVDHSKEDHPHAQVSTSAVEDENSDILEKLLKINSHLGEKLTEGDIAQKDTSNLPDGVLSNAAQCALSTCRWPKDADGFVHVPFVIDRTFSKNNADFIRQVMAEIEQVTCVRFEELNKRGVRQTDDYIIVTSETGCWSYVGRIGGQQKLSLQQSGCIYRQIIQHEFFHALGFFHEHTRSDRDNHVIIHYENINPDYIHNFDLQNTNNLQTPYDFLSVMQYSNRAFSINGQMTISAKDNPTLLFGGATAMSENDVLRVNKLYSCTAYLP
ncbi:hypothetical protein NL108_014178 [Boleophthalmus pectinirostris]|nr:hypothetical protein NL108_014178 [Boleophthalmus pectinirostris]